MNKFKLTTGVILVFLVGVLAGSLGTGLYLRYRMEYFKPGGHTPKMRAAFLMKRLSEDLDLTPAQKTEVEKIVVQSQEKIFAVRRKVFPEIKEIINETFASIGEGLNNKQKQNLEKLREKLKSWHGRINSNAPYPQIPKNSGPDF